MYYEREWNISFQNSIYHQKASGHVQNGALACVDMLQIMNNHKHTHHTH